MTFGGVRVAAVRTILLLASAARVALLVRRGWAVTQVFFVPGGRPSLRAGDAAHAPVGNSLAFAPSGFMKISWRGKKKDEASIQALRGLRSIHSKASRASHGDCLVHGPL